jgi:small subunit ribosomal protein S8
MVNDRISNLINGLKTASIAKKETMTVPSSKLVVSILELLKKQEFITDFSVNGDKVKKDAVITLKYENGLPAINDVKKVSKTSKRIYRGADSIKSVKSGYGLSVVTTPKGVISGSEARKSKVGGEVLFEIW